MTVSDFSAPPPAVPTQDANNEKGNSPWDDSAVRMTIGVLQLQLQNIAELVHYVHRNKLLTKGYEVELRDLGWQLAMQAKRLSKLSVTGIVPPRFLNFYHMYPNIHSMLGPKGTILKHDEVTTNGLERMVDEMTFASMLYTTIEALFLECTGVPLPEVGSERGGAIIGNEWDRLPGSEKTKKDFQVCKDRYVLRQNRITALQSYIEIHSKTEGREIPGCFWIDRLSDIKFAGARRYPLPVQSWPKVCATLTDSMKEDFERAILHRTPPIGTDYTAEQTQFFFHHRMNYYTYVGLWLVEQNSGLNQFEEFEEVQKAAASNWDLYTAKLCI